MTHTTRRSDDASPFVADLNDAFPTTCPIVQQVRVDYAYWYYDLADGYILYYLPDFGQHYEQRLVAERVFGKIPPGHIVRRRNRDRTDNRAENLYLISRGGNMLANSGNQPAETFTCANPDCDRVFKAERQRQQRSISGQLYCSPECRQYVQRKVKRPDAAELQQLMIDVGNWTALAQQFGVSDNAVRKWAKGYGLDLTLCNGRRKQPLTTA